MKTTAEDEEEKRLQRNSRRRERYAQLSKEKKAAMLEQNRKAYANRSEIEKLEKNLARRKAHAALPLQKKEAALKKNRQRYPDMNERYKFGQESLAKDKGEEAVRFNDNREDEARFRSTFEIGSSSSDPFGVAHPLMSSSLLPPAAAPEVITKPRTKRRKGSQKTPDNILKNIVMEPDTLPIAPNCKYCSAKRIYKEPKGFCCSNGEVALISNDIPNELYDLYTSKTDDASHFQTYVRTYNNTFAFTSFGVKYDKNLCQRNKGIYTFKVQGQVYHYINEIIATTNPSYMQLYFYDTEHELHNRMKSSPKLKANIVETLIHVLGTNPYATFFRSLTNEEDLTTRQIKIIANPELDQRVYNCPTSSQVAAIWLEDIESSERKSRDIIVYNHAGFTHKVKYYYGCYDPLQYPLLFSYGQSGWHEGIERANRRIETLCAGQLLIDPNKITSAEQIIEQEEKILAAAKKKRNTVSCREYYCYKLQMRPDDNSALLQAGRLLQQYIVDMYVKLETSRLDYFRNNQSEVRSEAYDELLNSIASVETRGSKVGRRIVLPSSFIGGPRDMRKRYMDAMALVQKFGKPDILLTMTCNPNWSEIKSQLQPGEESQNRADLVARVFRAKLELLKDELINNEILGPVAAYTYVIEYQKRGLPMPTSYSFSNRTQNY